MIYKYYVYQNSETIHRSLPRIPKTKEVLSHYRSLATFLRDSIGQCIEVIITDSSPEIGVLVNIDTNKSKGEVGSLLGESLHRLNSENPSLYLSARYMGA